MKNDRFINIIRDLYYRLTALPPLFLLWVLLLVWRRRIEKWQTRLMENRHKLDEIHSLSGMLEGQKYERQQKKLKSLEKYFLRLEEDVKADQERYEKNKELFQKYLGRVFEPTIG